MASPYGRSIEPEKPCVHPGDSANPREQPILRDVQYLTHRRIRLVLLAVWAIIGMLGIVQLITAEGRADTAPRPEHETEGYASWYAGKFQGRLTANGETFDTNLMTAAHKTLPFGTIVEVTHIGSGRAVEVRINDRGPFVEGRVIDLSRAAAEALAMTAEGIAPVRLRIVAEPEPPTHRIQIASFSSAESAIRVRDRIRSSGVAADIERAGDLHRVVVPGVAQDSLDGTLERLAELGHARVLVRTERRSGVGD